MTIALSPAERSVVRRILRRHVPRRSVYVFGSRANGKSRRFSDLDLAVMGSRPLSFNAVAAMKEDFSESDLPFRVDVLDWAATDRDFRALIDSGRRLIYEPK